MISLSKTCQLFVLGVSLFTTSYSVTTYSETLKTQKITQQTSENIKFGEWLYYPQSNPPTLAWWNERMSRAAPILYISFSAEKITLNAVTPLWPNTGIIFYLNDKTEKQGINLILQKRDQENCYYSATIDLENRQKFVNNLVTVRKARLITPISSQSLSLKQVNQAMQLIITTHPEINLILPSTTASQ